MDLTIYLYSEHRTVIFAIAQLSCSSFPITCRKLFRWGFEFPQHLYMIAENYRVFALPSGESASSSLFKFYHNNDRQSTQGYTYTARLAQLTHGKNV